MRFTVSFLVLIFFVACASSGKLVTPDQVTWIEKGVTTRDKIVERLGHPNFPEVPSTSTLGSMEYESISRSESVV